MGNKQIDVGDVSYPLRCFASIVICDNLNRLRELEEGERRVKFVDCIRSGDKNDELEKNATSHTDCNK